MSLSRSEQMSRIRGLDTRPEVMLKSALIEHGLDVDMHSRVDGVRADLVLKSERIVIFIDGCFWHGCPEHYVRSGSNAEFWAKKLVENVFRDSRQTRELCSAGWRVLRFWEHEVFENPGAVVARILIARVVEPTEEAGCRVIRVELVDIPARVEKRVVVRLTDPNSIVEERVGRRVTAKWKRPAGTRSKLRQPG